jgi:hypothetical protein
MPETAGYVLGDWNGQCDECGRSFKFSQLRKRWDGAYVDSACYEPRHPQDFVRAVRDDPSVPVARPDNIIYLVNSDNIDSEYVLAGETLG